MTTHSAQRRLTTILVADVAGFSRMVRVGEEATLRALATLRTDAVDPAIAGHGGRIFKTTGYGVLAEFPSVVGAVRAAVQVQTAMAAANAPRPRSASNCASASIWATWWWRATTCWATGSTWRRG